MAKYIPTFEEAKKAAETVRHYMNIGESCRGPQWTDETFNLSYILQEWRCPDIFDNSKNRNDFEEEYYFIHSASSYNWHMYEDPEY